MANETTSVPFGRYHSRVKHGPDYQCPYICHNTATPIHHDTYGGGTCDIADTFNGARDYAKSKLAANGDSLIHSYLGNTAMLLQCNGVYTASDGYAYEDEG